jgi:hypothetical protein
VEENSYWIGIFVFSLSKEARASSLRPTQIGTHQWQRLYGLSLIPLVDQSVSWKDLCNNVHVKDAQLRRCTEINDFFYTT